MRLSNILSGMIPYVFMFASSATLAATLDQEFNLIGSNKVLSVDVDNDLSQTFSVGITGTLSSIDLLIKSVNSTEDLMVDIRQTTVSGSPVEEDIGDEILGSFTVTADSINEPGAFTFKSFDVSALGIDITNGNLLAISLTSNESIGSYQWVVNTSGGYSGGEAYLRGADIGSSTWTTFRNSDLSFRTYVQPVPVPAAVWLFGSGLLGLIGIARRKKV